MGFEVNVDVPGWFVYLFGHSAKRLVVKSLTPGADVIYRCFADENMNVFGKFFRREDLPGSFLDLDRCGLHSNK